MIMVGALLMALFMFSWYKGINLWFPFPLFIVGSMLTGFFAHLDILTFNDHIRVFTLFYDLIAGILLIAGIMLFLDRVRSYGSPQQKSLFSGVFVQITGAPMGPWQKRGLNFLILTVVITLTVKDLNWPMDPYMVALSNNIFGQVAEKMSFFGLCLYTFLKFWVVWIALFIFSGSMLDKRIKLMIAAAFFLAAGSSLFYLK